MRIRVVPAIIVAAVVALCFWAIQPPSDVSANPAANAYVEDDLAAVVTQVDEFFQPRWVDMELQPAARADDMLMLRRLSLSLMGTIPSLEEIRQFEHDDGPDRMKRWTVRYLEDPRYADYFAERLARCYVGVENGPLIIFRRDRFVKWLSEQLATNEPYDSTVRKMVKAEGLWTGDPASNFITATQANGELDLNMLAARSARAFLGQSLDCAQCHDHFFAEWTQSQFEGLAAQFGEVEVGLGVHDKAGRKYTLQDRETLEDREVDPSVPFQPDLLPNEGSPREKFAVWLTHEQNRRFDRAIANRVWGLMFGRPFIAPVDDMGDPPEADQRDVLDILADDFRQHDCDLRRLIQVIAASAPYGLASDYPSEDEDELAFLDETWALFPMTRLRPEQVIGSMMQAQFVQTIDQNSHLFVRARRFFSEQNFVKAYGDLGDQELVERSGTIPQALLRMNGEMTRESIKSDWFSAGGRVSGMCETSEDVVETAYLVCVSRRPTAVENAHFLEMLGDRTGDARDTIVEDIFWALLNSPEFSWNH